jgi:hypothetical protein
MAGKEQYGAPHPWGMLAVPPIAKFAMDGAPEVLGRLIGERKDTGVLPLRLRSGSEWRPVDLYLLLALQTAGRAGVARAGTCKINGQMRCLLQGWTREVKVAGLA